MKGLDKQVYIYSLGTECFYTDEEYIIHNKLLRCHMMKKKMKEKIDNELTKRKGIELEIAEFIKNKVNGDKNLELYERRNKNKIRLKQLRGRSKVISDTIKNLKSELHTKFVEFDSVRELRNDTLTTNKIIGIFDSALSRTIGMKINEISESLIVVRAFYFNILEDIIRDGFIHNGEKYIYFSSSAGQIRTKKTVFIKESLWNEHEKTLTCGLTLDDINNNESQKGCNVNKYLAYKALISSASVKWNNFDIDRAIVVHDLASPVTSEFDYINRDTYEITRKELTVNIEHTDGCGMVLASKYKKSFMTRLPFVKGLLVPFAFDKFALKYGKTKITDIYGKEWDIIEDKIEVIFTKSQFKMAKYYENWEDYKEKFKLHKCHANKLNEEDLGGEATLNYQMLQTLTDITDKELKELASETIEDVKKLHTDKHTILKILGATANNKKKTYLQEALSIYPELINDIHSKRIIKDKKKSLVDSARAGRLRINGKYLYIVPDLYAFCEKLLLGIDNPLGLLSGHQVYTSVFNEGKVDILRSPHLYKEHAIREIVKNEILEEWFTTQGIYTSIHDPISRILQFDVDGDKALVVQNDTFTSIAERNMKGVVPLFYDAGIAAPVHIDSEKIYESLIAAFKANIGEVSNNITKIFNSGDEIDLDVVKWLTAENNYIIDYAKTMYMPVRPPEVDERIRKAIKGKVPHFFQEAKKKDKGNVEGINNSTVNSLRKIVTNPKLKLEDIAGTFDYKMLMSEDIPYVNRKIVDTYRKLTRSKRWLMRDNGIKDRNEGLLYVYKHIKDEIAKIEPDDHKVVNVLVKELYSNLEAPVKETLWHCYGETLVSNLRENLKGTKQCECCGVRIEKEAKNNKYCKECYLDIRNKQNKEKALKYYYKNK